MYMLLFNRFTFLCLACFYSLCMYLFSLCATIFNKSSSSYSFIRGCHTQPITEMLTEMFKSPCHCHWPSLSYFTGPDIFPAAQPTGQYSTVGRKNLLSNQKKVTNVHRYRGSECTSLSSSSRCRLVRLLIIIQSALYGWFLCEAAQQRMQPIPHDTSRDLPLTALEPALYVVQRSRRRWRKLLILIIFIYQNTWFIIRNNDEYN